MSKKWDITWTMQQIIFHTANGPTPAYEVARLRVSELAGRILPYVLENTPPVVTIGNRFIFVGYAFIWPTGGDPFFVTPN